MESTVKAYYHNFRTIIATNNEMFLGYQHTVTGHVFYEEGFSGEILEHTFPQSRVRKSWLSPLPTK